MSTHTLVAESRDATGKSPAARRLRRTGKVPGILYRTGGALPFSAERLDVNAILRHGATLVELKIDGTTHNGIVKDYQVHPVREDVMHIDFQEVNLDETVSAVVPLHFVGEAPGVKAGGVLSEGVHELHIEARPNDIPAHIEVDVSELGMGEHVTVAGLTLPQGVAMLTDADTVLASITTADVVTDTPAVPAEGEAAAEAGEGGEAEASEESEG